MTVRPGVLWLVVWLVVPGGLGPARAVEGDPLEGFNRAMFWFNDRLDVCALEPIARGWDRALPDAVQDAFSDFFANLRFPVLFVNHVLQGKPRAAAVDVGRVLTNTLCGFFGFIDTATHIGMERQEEDFGQTLGVWGVPAGPYLVLPLIGPSNPRDAVGYVVDSFSHVYPLFVPTLYLIPPNAVRVVNARSLLLEEVEQARQASVDYYAAVRAAYIESREAEVRDRGELSEERQRELYEVDE